MNKCFIKIIGDKVYNHKGDYLGFIEFKKDWKKYKQFIFNPDDGTFFTSGCLAEISKDLETRNAMQLLHEIDSKTSIKKAFKIAESCTNCKGELKCPQCVKK